MQAVANGAWQMLSLQFFRAALHLVHNSISLFPSKRTSQAAVLLSSHEEVSRGALQKVFKALAPGNDE